MGSAPRAPRSAQPSCSLWSRTDSSVGCADGDYNDSGVVLHAYVSPIEYVRCFTHSGTRLSVGAPIRKPRDDTLPVGREHREPRTLLASDYNHHSSMVFV